MTPDKQAAPSEWVERGMELAEGMADRACGTDCGEFVSEERATLRAHLEAKEREHQSDREVTVKVCNEMGALQALVEQLAEALELLLEEEEAGTVCNMDRRNARAALAAHQQHVATQEKT